jgi:antitoxin component YwqK of YwqJK toxin-antitoxin module
MKKHFTLLMISCLSLMIISCNQGKETTLQPEEGNAPKVVKKKREDGTLTSLNPLDENGYIHGVKVNYYEDGVTVHSRITYEHGRKQGPAIWYFKSGKIYEYTNYYQNRKSGITKRYYETGELYQEVTYDTGEELPGKKTYDKAGNLISQ